MKKRDLLKTAASAAAVARALGPLPANSARIPVVALFVVGRAEGDDAANVPMVATVRQALAELGWADGQNVRLEVHHAQGRIESLRKVAEELATRNVDVVVAGGGTVTAESFRVIRAVPIVMSASAFDPVQSGWAESYARPGRNVTGLTFATDEAVEKQLELLTKIVPSVRHLGILRTRGNVANAMILDRARSVAGSLGLTTTLGEVGSASDLEVTVDKLRSSGADALLVVVDPEIDNLRNRIADLGIRFRMPTIGQLPFYAEAGFLLTYAADVRLLHRRAASFVDRILRGAKAGELPIERPTKFMFTLNRRTARAMGLSIDPTVLALADEVIE